VRTSPLSRLFVNWRLKLLALVLTVGLLAAVSFSENPPVFETISVRVQYVHRPDDLVLISPPTSVDVPVAGLKDDVERYRQTAAGVTIDLSKARPGPSQTYWAAPRADVQGVTVRQTAIPVHFGIEPLVTRELGIEVRTPNKSPGLSVVASKTYATCGNPLDVCQVTVAGPGNVVNALKAYVNYDVSITSADSRTSPDEPILFEEGGRPIDLRRDLRTIPAVAVTPLTVTVNVTTQGGVQAKMVPVSLRVSGTQACGYQISSVEVQPALVSVSGPIDAVSKLTAVSMDPVSLTGLASSQSFVRPVSTGSDQVSASPSAVTVRVALAQAFSCAAPTPTAALLVPTVSPPGPSPPAPSPSTG